MKNISKRTGYLIVAAFWLAILTLWSTKTQAQMLPCDSISYTILSGSGGNTTLQLNGMLTPGFPGIVSMWEWQVCDDALCFADTNQSATFNQFTTADTLKVNLGVYIIANGDTCYIDLPLIKLIYVVNGWEIMGEQGTTITEIQSTNYMFDNRIFDLLGREYYTNKSIPFGLIYIQNGKKYIKVK